MDSSMSVGSLRPSIIAATAQFAQPTEASITSNGIPLAMSCQICLEEPVPSANPIVTSICCRLCPANVCVRCLARHVDVSLDQFYPGLLPVVRCPICLVPLHLSRWASRLVMSTSLDRLQERYDALCVQACALLPPCCHQDEYTHLPDFDLEFTPPNPLQLLPSQVATFRELVRRFCRHRLEARPVLDYALATFGEEKAAELLDHTFRLIVDAERRARLLLAFMFLRPNTATRCCKFDICFNCKGVGHHYKCPDFDVAVNEDYCFVRCRTCRVLLMKVEGCDSVRCVCGFDMDWHTEVDLRARHKKQTLPVDLFDVAGVEAWQQSRNQIRTILSDMVLKLQNLRRPRLNQWVARYQEVLRPVVADHVWRRRFNKTLLSMKAELRYELDWPVADRRAHYLWKKRHSREIFALKRDLYWKAYYKIHPEELEDVNEAFGAFLAVDV